jgi:hypothetical protein
MKNAARGEVELGLAAFVVRFEFCYYPWGEGQIGWNSDVDMVGGILGRNFDIKNWEACMRGMHCNVTFDTEARLNSMYEFSPHRTENTDVYHHEDQLVNAV